MTDEIAARRAAARATQAARILEDELVVEAFQVIHDRLHEAWQTSRPEQHEYREDLWRTLDVLRHFRGFFARVVRDGQIAATEIEQIDRERTAKR